MSETVTIKTIATILGVSTSTVSRALQGNMKIGHRTRERVLELAEELKYVPNLAAQRLKSKQTETIGIIVPNLREEYFSHLITGVEDAFEKRGFQTIICQSRDDYKREKSAVEHFLKTRVDGVIVSLASSTTDYQHFISLQNYGIPIVFCDRTPKKIPSFKVRSSLEKGMTEAIEFLKNRGLERIGLLNGPSALFASDERLNAYLTAMSTLGMKTSREWITSTDLSQECNQEKTRDLLEMNLDAIIIFNDYVGIDAVKEAKKSGIEPNKDVLFITFGNNPIINYMENGPIASVEQFPFDIGFAAGNLLQDILIDKTLEPKEIIVDGTLRILE